MIAFSDSVYSELRHAARRLFARERPGQFLPPEALVHETWLRLALVDSAHWREPAHFRSVAIRQMRRLLIDQSRQSSVRADVADLSHAFRHEASAPFEISDLGDAVERLRRASPDSARVVELKFFSGMTDSEIAATLGCSPRTVRRYWAFARSWLFRLLGAS